MVEFVGAIHESPEKMHNTWVNMESDAGDS